MSRNPRISTIPRIHAVAEETTRQRITAERILPLLLLTVQQNIRRPRITGLQLKPERKDKVIPIEGCNLRNPAAAVKRNLNSHLRSAKYRCMLLL
jgi:hypothetical protein